MRGDRRHGVRLSLISSSSTYEAREGRTAAVPLSAACGLAPARLGGGSGLQSALGASDGSWVSVLEAEPSLGARAYGATATEVATRHWRPAQAGSAMVARTIK
jgi:hypothetical protein